MTNKALLVGINLYRTGSDLRGCVNDVESVSDVLGRYYGFREDDITVLLDHDATKSAIMSGLATLVSDLGPGDLRYVHFSGHGSNVPDKNGDEADFRDEILCPTDLDWYDPLTDDSLRNLLDNVPDRANVTVVMDCCHSGSVTRAILPPDSREPIARFLPSPLDLQAAESGRELRGALRGVRIDAVGGAGDSDVKDIDVPEVLITGCRADQTSADAYIDGRYQGALTSALVKAIEESEGKLSYRDLHTVAQRRLSDSGFRQVPQLEGRAANLDRGFLQQFA